MNARHSIRFQLMSYLFFLVAICIVVMGFSDSQVSDLLRASSSLFQCNQNLSDFYTTADAMDYVAREYIYSPSEDNYAQYRKYNEEARSYLEKCRQNVDSETGKKLIRLEYMLDYYAEPLELFMEGDRGQYETYTLLQYRGKLISATSGKYYEYLAESMSAQTQRMQTQWEHRRIILIAVSVLIVLIGILLGIYYKNSIYDPIQIMVNNTEKIKHEDYELENPRASSSELIVLERAFADMSVRIKEDMENLREKARLEQELLKRENENLLMKNLMTETELQNLQSQINPHFLFNTMNMISKSAYLHNDIQTSELMDKLSAFLRYALDKADKVSTLREEIKSIENYIYIQQRRFGSRVRFMVDIPENIPNIAMPAIIIQPLIENAIIHGVGKMTEKAEIVVAASVDEEALLIHVEDNGAGMNAEQLEELQVHLHRVLSDASVSRNKSSIGLANVYKRLKLYYGDNLEFFIESEADCGTIITIGIPREVWNEQ